MVSLKDFLDIMEGSKVTIRTSCSSEEVIISINKLLINIDGYTYFSVEKVYNDYKDPKVKTWDYEDKYLDEGILKIWCQE